MCIILHLNGETSHVLVRPLENTAVSIHNELNLSESCDFSVLLGSYICRRYISPARLPNKVLQVVPHSMCWWPRECHCCIRAQRVLAHRRVLALPLSRNVTFTRMEDLLYEHQRRHHGALSMPKLMFCSWMGWNGERSPVLLSLSGRATGLHTSRFWVEKGGRKHRKYKSLFCSAIKFLAQVHTIQP